MKHPDYSAEGEYLPEIDLGEVELVHREGGLLLEEMRLLLAPVFGVTVVGPYVTLRFKAKNGGHTEVQMQVKNLTNSKIREPHDPDWNK